LFVKGRFGKASKNVFKIENNMELESILKVVKEPIIQQYIESKEFTIDLFADFYGNVLSVVPRERINIFGGESIVGTTFKNIILQNQAARLSESLGLIGHNTIQCFFNGIDVNFIEVNPRYGGGATISILAGADSPYYLLKLLNGEKVEKSYENFADGFKVMRYIEDVIISDEACRGVKKID
jgi:carbamoyl-phosphate synthase large subunit